jgi:chitosanase
MSIITTFKQKIREYPLEIGTSVVAAIAIAICGYTFGVTQAASPSASVEAEQNIAGGAKIANDTPASGGKALQFNGPATTPPAAVDLHNATKKDIAMQLVSTAENSSLDWKAQYSYIEYNVECYWLAAGQRTNCGNSDNRGYTGGIIGFTTKTNDLLALVKYYKQIAPGNILEKYIPTLEKVNGTSSQTGLGTAFTNDWKTAANNADGKFRQAQDYERDRVYFNPAVSMAKTDGVRTLGQFIYYDAAVMHGPDDWGGGLVNIRAEALKKAKTPAQGGDEKIWLNAFLDARKAEMLKETGHSDTTRVDTMQRKFLNEGNYDLNTPLSWSVYGDPFSIK